MVCFGREELVIRGSPRWRSSMRTAESSSTSHTVLGYVYECDALSETTVYETPARVSKGTEDSRLNGSNPCVSKPFL